MKHLRSVISWDKVIFFHLEAFIIFSFIFGFTYIIYGNAIYNRFFNIIIEIFGFTVLSQLVLIAVGYYDENRVKAKFLRGILGFLIVYFIFSTLKWCESCIRCSLICLPLICGGLILLRRVYFRFFSKFLNGKEKILILGGEGYLEEISEIRSLDKFQIVGFIKSSEIVDNGRNLTSKFNGFLNEVNKVVVAMDQRRGKLPVDFLLKCRLRGIKVVDIWSFYENLTGKIVIKGLKPSWLIFSDGFKINKVKKRIKRIVDIVFSLIGLILSSPIMILTAILIKFDSKGPIIYKQERVGENGKIFTIFKFRSMYVNAEKLGPTWAKENDPRITRVGRIIRKFRIDELPQLINVLKGDMSFVGPRPERPCFVEDLSKKIPYYKCRLAVKPGITGWAAIKYKYSGSVEESYEKLQYDLYYIKNFSFILDLYIIIKTIGVVLFAEGAI